MNNAQPIIIAVPKGRILEELLPILARAGLEPEKAFFDENSRQLKFASNHKGVEIIRVRSFDVATFVAHGAAQLGVAGSDVLEEFSYQDIYVPVDLGIGKCRMSVAAPKGAVQKDESKRDSHIRIATKYPNITSRYFAKEGVQAECIPLHGAMELAPSLGLCRRIVDLVSSGKTLKENGLEELEVIMQISSRLIVNKGAYKTRRAEIQPWITAFEGAVGHAAA